MSIPLEVLLELIVLAGQLAKVPAPVLAALPTVARNLYDLIERWRGGATMPEIRRAVLPDDAALVRQGVEAELAKDGGS